MTTCSCENLTASTEENRGSRKRALSIRLFGPLLSVIGTIDRNSRAVTVVPEPLGRRDCRRALRAAEKASLKEGASVARVHRPHRVGGGEDVVAASHRPAYYNALAFRVSHEDRRAFWAIGILCHECP